MRGGVCQSGGERAELAADPGGSLESGDPPPDPEPNVEYLSTICRFGETIMAKLPKPGTKAQKRWIRGIWVGRLDRDNTNIVLKKAGALSVRSVRRLPPEPIANRTLMGT